VQIIFSFVQNIISSIIANQMYPFMKKNKDLKLSVNEKNEIFLNIKAMMFHKIGGVVLNATDNVIISSSINITTVGIFSNYVMLVNSVSAFLSQCFTSFTAGIGNLLVKDDEEKNYRIFKEIFLINFWLYSI